MTKIIIAGGRDFKGTPLFIRRVDKLINRIEDQDITIISGKARGADKFGEDYAEARGYPVEYYPADWDQYGKSAGYIRNKEMAKNATHLIAFWDGKSKGTKHMIDLARSFNLKICVIKYKICKG